MSEKEPPVPPSRKSISREYELKPEKPERPKRPPLPSRAASFNIPSAKSCQGCSPYKTMGLNDIPNAVLNESTTGTTPRSSVESNSSSISSETNEAGVSEQLRRFQSVFKVQMGHLSTAVEVGKRQTEKEILLLRSKLEDAQLNERRTQTVLNATLRRESILEKEVAKLEDQIDQQNSLLDVSRDATDENLNLRLQLDELKLENTRLAAFEKLGICSICVEEGSFDDSEKKMSCLSVCGHMLCSSCASKGNTCPHCRIEFTALDVLHLFPS